MPVLHLTFSLFHNGQTTADRYICLFQKHSAHCLIGSSSSYMPFTLLFFGSNGVLVCIVAGYFSPMRSIW